MADNNARSFAVHAPSRPREVAVAGIGLALDIDDIDDWDATEAVVGGRHGGLGIHHRHAAFHFETAEHHHREAVRHDGAGNHEDARLHAQAAHTHGKAAREHAEQAHAQDRGGPSSGEDAPSPTMPPVSGVCLASGSEPRVPNGHGYDDDRGLGESVAPVQDDETGTG